MQHALLMAAMVVSRDTSQSSALQTDIKKYILHDYGQQIQNTKSSRGQSVLRSIILITLSIVI